jgi:hypothetical protein
MRHARPQPIRNKLDLSDRVQVRLIRKRLRLSDAQLAEIVDRIGNSIAAISKEVATQRASRPPEAVVATPPAAVIASIAPDQTPTSELRLNEQAP